MNELVAEHFDVVLHRTVLNEMIVVLRRVYPRWRERGLVSEEMSEIRRSHASWTATRCCNTSLDADKDLLEAEDLDDLNDGEIDCIALANYTADERFSYVLFLTDDYVAGECAKQVFDKYQIGMVIRSADLISFFGIRLKLAKPEIHQGLRNLIAFYTSLYESLLKEVKILLPGSESSYVFPLVYRGDFASATEAISRLTLNIATREKLSTLIKEVAALAAEKSVLGHSLLRLRALDEINL